MSDPTEGPAAYRVIYSERVRLELKELLTRARALGFEQSVRAAAAEIDARLHIYPQFGEPLRDLVTQPQTLWHGTVPPLVVEYVLDETRRLVAVGVPFRPLPGCGL